MRYLYTAVAKIEDDYVTWRFSTEDLAELPRHGVSICNQILESFVTHFPGRFTLSDRVILVALFPGHQVSLCDSCKAEEGFEDLTSPTKQEFFDN